MVNDIAKGLELFEAAVEEPMRRTAQEYQAYLVALYETFGVEVRIVSPTGKSWSREFRGLEARPEHVRRIMEDVVYLLE